MSVKLFVAAAAGSVLIAAQIANAETVAFNFNESGNNFYDSLTYSGPAYTPFTLKLTAGIGAGSYNASDAGADVFRGGNSIGVRSATEFAANNFGTGSLGRQISGSEILWLTFSPFANIGTAFMSLDGANEGARFYRQNGSIITPALVSGSSTYTFSDLNTNVIGIGYAGSASVTGNNAGIKLDALTVSTVPLPPAALAGAALLAGVAWVRRRGNAE